MPQKQSVILCLHSQPCTELRRKAQTYSKYPKLLHLVRGERKTEVTLKGFEKLSPGTQRKQQRADSYNTESIRLPAIFSLTSLPSLPFPSTSRAYVRI